MAIGVTISLVSILPFIFSLYFLTLNVCTAIQIITPTQYITDPENITSSDGFFKLGFFSPGNSSNRYVGIWYNKIQNQTVLWVGNRENPLTDSSGVFTIGDDGNLVVLDGQKKVLWSTNVSGISFNSSAELSESGNLILREVNSNFGNNNKGRILWQSFEHPSHTMIPGMRLLTNLRTGENQVLTSWKSDSDPSYGSFFVELDPLSIPQVIISNGSPGRPNWRSGPWNKRVFIGIEYMYSAYQNGFDLVRDDREGIMYLTLSDANTSSLVKYDFNSQGKLIETNWNDGENRWEEGWSAPHSECDFYGRCGLFGSCNVLESPYCSCLRGFEPKSIEEWSKGNWSGGCVRKTQLQCERNNTNGEVSKADGFLKFERMKVPDFVNFWVYPKDLNDCEQECLKNCSCIAYSYDTGIGCMWWSRNLIDMEKFSIGEVDLYIRVAHSELNKKNAKVVIIITVISGVLIMVVGLCTYISCRRMTKHRGKKKKNEMEILLFNKGNNTSREFSDSKMLGDNPYLPIFNFEMLAIATNNFDIGNKLGQGGFGSVYKGKLPDGQEIAVKRLSKSSGQGVEEFKNEVVVISKLQHRNLVRLLGCCIEADEKMLIYEYLPNKSLDSFLFDPTKRALLDWRKRLQIIVGIGRGILYLHRDSRLRVIHRDLKASNILLDEDLNPKISDFGMARIFGGDELQANTIRVVGTYGYMSPEYAMEGLFSEKSDVFSFGVLLLEIVSGKRNTSFHNHEQSWSLLGYAWKLWKEGEVSELIDSMLSEPYSTEEILRCIHVGLLCVQDFAKDRPTVSTIISMLTSEITNLPTPKEPTFSGRQNSSQEIQDSTCSTNNVTITDFVAR